jgi:Flp pilus assembly protein TadG
MSAISARKGVRNVVIRKEGRPERERGQILVIFALALIAIIGMVGLVLDGGSAFAQRRTEQNAADLASVAGANAYLHAAIAGTGNTTTWQAAAVAAAQASATRNGYTNGTGGVTVSVSTTLLQSGVRVAAAITAPHPNTFARIFGMSTWGVSVNAGAITGTIDSAVGAAPWTMSILAFNPDGTPKYDKNNPQDFGETNGDYPTSALDIAWTDFNGNNNVNTSEVSAIIQGSNVVTATFVSGQYLGQHNQGNHTALYGDVDTYLSGKSMPVPVVGAGPCLAPQQAYLNGCFKGWAFFHITGASGGSNKHITGYFDDNFVQSPLSVGDCQPNQQSYCGIISAGQLDNVVVRLDQ